MLSMGESVSEYITVPVCESKPPSPFVTAEFCLARIYITDLVG